MQKVVEILSFCFWIVPWKVSDLMYISFTCANFFIYCSATFSWPVCRVVNNTLLPSVVCKRRVSSKGKSLKNTESEVQAGLSLIAVQWAGQRGSKRGWPALSPPWSWAPAAAWIWYIGSCSTPLRCCTVCKAPVGTAKLYLGGTACTDTCPEGWTEFPVYILGQLELIQIFVSFFCHHSYPCQLIQVLVLIHCIF